jgi:signal peptidase
MRFVRGPLVFVGWVGLGLLLGVFLVLTVSTAFGYRSLVVMSGSMEPALHVGDVVIVREIAPLDARIGDVVTFTDPEDPSRLLTHRVRSITVSGSDVSVQTMGDANTTAERWQISENGLIGRVEVRLRHLGYVMSWLRSRFGRLGFVAIPALALGVLELRRVWRPRRSLVVDPGGSS